MSSAIWWIRRDLRLTDNQTLQGALDTGDRLIPLFILDPALLSSSWVGEKRKAFLFAGLHALDQQLQDIGSRLIVREGNPLDVLRTLTEAITISTIHAERDHSPYATRRDQRIATVLPLQLHEGVTVRPLGTVIKDDGTPYTVFTPYARRWLAAPPIMRTNILPAPKAVHTPQAITSNPLPPISEVSQTLPFHAGERYAKEHLRDFIKGESAPVYDYANLRNNPIEDATSQLSPYLRFGMISPRLAALAGYTAMADAPNESAHKGATTWLNELIWRDFYLTILAAFPHVRQGAFRPAYDAMVWDNDEQAFHAWSVGETGYPFVDAAMRQLRASGWMHNRARMVVASFLVKDLLIDWRWGERWFMQQLIDGDPAANNGGWQWVAGSGTDAAPYFRIFNPISQSEKFDPKGGYIRRWVPELHNVPDAYIHAPWKMPANEQRWVGCTIGHTYPLPIIDHKWARVRTLAAYKKVK